MNKKKSKELERLCDAVIYGIQEKKGSEIVKIDLQNIPNAITDAFIICTGNSDTQVDAIATEIEKQVELKTNQNPIFKEGIQQKEWILLDYIDLVVHVFKKEKRAFYDIESLWGDAKVTYFDDAIHTSNVTAIN